MQEESAQEDDEQEEWSLVIELYIFFSCTPAAGLHKINLVVSQACVQ